MTLLTLATLVLTTATPGTAVCAEPGATPPAADSLQAFWEEAVPFREFYGEVERRAALWRRNYGEGQVPGALVERARAVGGTWRLLAVAVDGCSDSVNTIPWMALLAEAVPGLELRVLDPTAGRSLMEARPTADGRAATPTVVLLDEDFDDAGCFVERPRPLKAWIEEQRHIVGEGTLYEGKMLWYDQDRGRATLEEVVGLLEAAAAGEPVCEG